MGNRVGEGPGETRPETGPAREDRGTPGARGDDAGSGATARNGSPQMTPPPDRDPLPTCVRDLDAAAGRYLAVAGRRGPAVGADRVCPRRSSAAIGRPRPAAPGLERGDQPQRHPRARDDRTASTSSTASRRYRSCAGPASTSSSTSAAAAATPACRWPWPCRRVGPCSWSRSPRRRASWPRRWRSPGVGDRVARGRRPAPRRWRPTRPTAAAGGRWWRGPWRT